MTDNYQSPYGFDPVTDALLDVIADRRELTPDQLADIIMENRWTAGCRLNEGVADWIDEHAWDTLIAPTINAIEDRIFPKPTMLSPATLTDQRREEIVTRIQGILWAEGDPDHEWSADTLEHVADAMAELRPQT